MEKRNIDSLLASSEEELYRLLGNELWEAEKKLNAFPPTKSQLIATAEKFLSKNWIKIQDLICKDNFIRKVDNNDTVTMIFAISDLISSIVTGISPITVAVIIYKYGIERLCPENE